MFIYINWKFICELEMNVWCVSWRNRFMVKASIKTRVCEVWSSDACFFVFFFNLINQCFYLKICGNTFIFLVLNVGDILLTSSDISLLMKTKGFLLENFELEDLGDVSFAFGIGNSNDRSRGIFASSWKFYVNHMLKKLYGKSFFYRSPSK